MLSEKKIPKIQYAARERVEIAARSLAGNLDSP